MIQINGLSQGAIAAGKRAGTGPQALKPKRQDLIQIKVWISEVAKIT